MPRLDMETLQARINNSGLASDYTTAQRAILLAVTANVNRILAGEEELTENEKDLMYLNAVGPGAASAAEQHATNVCREAGKLTTRSGQEPKLNGNFAHNVRTIHNDCDVDGQRSWSSVLREFLLPRYAYLDFDRVVDPRHMIDLECGYPKFVTPIMYRYLYDRDDVARRVVDIYPDESWAADPDVYNDEREDNVTPFEESWRDLCDSMNALQYLYRIDRLAGIGHYGVLLLGLDDGKDLEQPVDEPELLAGVRRSVGKTQRSLLYMRPFDEYLSFIHQYETDVMHPRYGLPKFYNLVFLDMTIDAAGASIGTRLNRRVHWTRVVHVADNLQSSLVFGIPRMQPVFNRLLDLRKIKGGSAEMFWKGAFPGISFELDPRFVTDRPEFDKKEFREEIERYSDGLQRYIAIMGMSAKSLAPQVADPRHHVKVQMEAIAANLGVPSRIFMGSEEARLASSQDKLTWNQRLGRKLKTFTTPSVLRNFIDRLIALGVVPPPDVNDKTKKRDYFVDWDDLNTPTDEDKANLSLKWTQALSQYVASGVVHLIPPMEYLTMIVGLTPSQARFILDAAESAGGLDKLKKVDPSQGAGVNGKAENNVTKGSREGTAGERPKPRDAADKAAEGSS